MLQKSMLVAGVLSLVGLSACMGGGGCSGGLLEPDLRFDFDAGFVAYDARYDGPKKMPPELDAPYDELCPTTQPITAADIEAALPWRPPAPIQTVCTQQNLDDLKALFTNNGGGVKFADIKTALGPTCAACAFSPMGGPTWQVFVEDKGGAVDNRTGSCFAQLAGPDCGKQRFTFESCLEAACPEVDCGVSGIERCKQKATKGACRDITDAYAKACPDESELVMTCGNVLSAIVVSCSGGADAGLDASIN